MNIYNELSNVAEYQISDDIKITIKDGKLLPQDRNEMDVILDKMWAKNRTEFWQNVSCWDIDISHVIKSSHWDLSSLFSDKKNINFEGIEHWNTTWLTNTIGMFEGQITFNRDINNWDMSQVTNMDSMFEGCTSFNQPLDKWNTSKVTWATDMFNNAILFNQNLNSWDMSNLWYANSMFYQANSFNQDITWKCSQLKETGNMFAVTQKFDWDVSWLVTNATTDISHMFTETKSFTGKWVENWDVSNVTNASYAFNKAEKFNGDMSWLNFASLMKWENMFDSAINFSHRFPLETLRKHYDEIYDRWTYRDALINFSHMFKDIKRYNYFLWWEIYEISHYTNIKNYMFDYWYATDSEQWKLYQNNFKHNVLYRYYVDEDEYYATHKLYWYDLRDWTYSSYVYPEKVKIYTVKKNAFHNDYLDLKTQRLFTGANTNEVSGDEWFIYK